MKDRLGHGSDAVPVEPRFFAKVDVGNSPAGCWMWTGGASDGYGTFRIGSRMLKAHVVAYELCVGPIPAGTQLDHLCRETLCVNPLHLEPVTRGENLRRGRRACGHGHETHCPQGHRYNEANTYIHRDGSRACRRCRADGARRAYRRRKERV